MWQIIHWICGQRSPKTNSFQGCDQNLTQITRLYRWSKYSLKFRRLGILLHVPKYLRGAYASCILYVCEFNSNLWFFLGPVTALGSPSNHCVIDFKFRGSIPIRDKRFFFSPEQSRPTLGPTQTSFNGKRGRKVRRLRMSGAIPVLFLYAFTGWTGTYLMF